ncbi:hypothetical protein JK192_13750 [Gluconobacter cerinus]|uniref:hypothetical protein n=1 Tax=Gluconobacter cerinus TaxID=38307 RepID=UPI001B8D42CB|nr:hypothetical protein [Gluconobacter cerinus]MBS1032442.1 hypothetical protein [Gluconobacter cerinus]
MNGDQMVIQAVVSAIGETLEKIHPGAAKSLHENLAKAARHLENQSAVESLEAAGEMKALCRAFHATVIKKEPAIFD